MSNLAATFGTGNHHRHQRQHRDHSVSHVGDDRHLHHHLPFFQLGRPALRGTYTVGLVADQRPGHQRRRRRGQSVAAVPSLIDTVAPTATADEAAPNVPIAQSLNTTTTVQVTYADAGSRINTSTFGTGNITVNHGATVTGVSNVGDVVTYTITAPASNWGSSPQGTYTISLVAGSVRDNAGNGVAGVASFGSFACRYGLSRGDPDERTEYHCGRCLQHDLDDRRDVLGPRVGNQPFHVRHGQYFGHQRDSDRLLRSGQRGDVHDHVDRGELETRATRASKSA